MSSGGERRTVQRTAIVAALEKAGRPLSPQEIRKGAARRAPGIGIATIYRNLKRLLETHIGRMIVRGDLGPAQTVVVDAEEGELAFRVRATADDRERAA